MATDPSDARYLELQHQGALTGRRLVVRYTPTDAVRLGVDRLVEQGFARRDEDLGAKLRGEGSTWTAEAAWIGDRKKSWRRGIVADLVEDLLPVDLIPGLRRAIAPTLAIVAARALADGTTELYIVPLASHTGDPEAAFGAAPLVRKAIRAAEETAAGAGAFVAADPPILGVSEPDHPASRAAAKRLLGWK